MAINIKPLCFYHPTRIIFLDDNRAFLDAMELEFDSIFNILTFTDHAKALEMINFSQIITPIRPINSIETDALTDSILGFDVSSILNLIYNKARFDQVVVLVVDYEMPDVNGIEFCRKIKDKKIFKIMLTAEADKDTAINAFNNGLIDKFILKTDENLHSEIISSIEELTERYFKEYAKNIFGGHISSINSLFENTLYQQLFSSIRTEVQAVEHYIIDHFGSILFLNKNANPTWLIVRHSKELAEQLDLLQGYDISNEVMNSIIKKEKMLCLLSEKEYKKPIDEWLIYLFDSKKLDENYHYSIIKNELTDSIIWDNTASYSDYLAERNRVI